MLPAEDYNFKFVPIFFYSVSLKICQILLLIQVQAIKKKDRLQHQMYFSFI